MLPAFLMVIETRGFERVTSDLANDVVILTGFAAVTGILGRLVYTALRRRLKEELHQTNGGSSVRDFINRTTDFQERTVVWQGTVDETLETLRGRMDAHEGYHRGLEHQQVITPNNPL